MANLTLSLISPEKILFQDIVTSLRCPMTEGEIGIWANHAPFLGKIGTGLIQIASEKGDFRYAVDQGFIEVQENKVSILVTKALSAQEHNESARISIEEKIAQLKSGNLGDPKVQSEIAWLHAQIRLLSAEN